MDDGRRVARFGVVSDRSMRRGCIEGDFVNLGLLV